MTDWVGRVTVESQSSVEVSVESQSSGDFSQLSSVEFSQEVYIYAYIYTQRCECRFLTESIYIYTCIYIQRCEWRFLSEILSLQRPHSLSYSSHSAVTIFFTTLRLKMTKNNGKKKDSKSVSLQTESLSLQRCECLFLCHSLTHSHIHFSHSLCSNVFLALSFSHSLSLQR